MMRSSTVRKARGRTTLAGLVAAFATLLLLAPAASVGAVGQAALPRPVFPDTIALPDGFAPEGIAVGRGTTFYTGSLVGGDIYRGNLRTGEGEIIVPPQEGQVAVGMKVDHRNRLWVAGGGTGTARVYDAGSGELLRTYELSSSTPTFVNDVVVTQRAAWFTDSMRPVLYRVPIAPDGTLGPAEEVPLDDEIPFIDGFNLNGIDATPSGKTLIVAHSTTGELFTIDAATGEAEEIDLGGAALTNADGILLTGRTLYVVQNRANQIAVVDLAADLSSGRVERTLTDPDFDVPTTIARFGAALYAVNARFGTTPTPTTEYSVVRVGLHDHA